MRHKQNLALSSSNSSTVSPYELGFQCPLHPDEDHMAVCRAQSGVMDSSLSTTHLLLEYFKKNSSLFCLKENVVVDRAALTGALNPLSNPGDSSCELKDSTTPHVQGGHIDEKYSLWFGPYNVADCASSSVNSDGKRLIPSAVIGPNPGTPKHTMKDLCPETVIPITKCTVLRLEKLRKKVKLILHTCNDKENKAILTSLTPPAIDGNKIADKVVYDGEGFAKIGMFGEKLVAVLFTGQGDMARGNLQTAFEKYTNVTEIVGVGVGYGNPHKEEICLGDVMVSDVIVKGSMTDEWDKYTFSHTVPVNDKLLQHARNLQNDWENTFPVASNPDRTSKVHLGSIVSTDTLVKAAASRDKYMETNRKAIGGEMEGWVLLSVLDEMRRKDRIIGIIVIKGVGGYGDKEDDKVWQPTAAMAAVSFVHYVLDYCGPL